MEQASRAVLWIVARIPTSASACVNGLFYFGLTANPYGAAALATGLATADLLKPECFRRGASVGLRVSGLFLVAVSLAASLGFVGDARLASSSSFDQAEARIAVLDQRISAIPDYGSAEDLRQQAKKRRVDAAEEGSQGGCYDICRGIKAEADALSSKAAKAGARERLEAERAELVAQAPQQDALVELVKGFGVDGALAVLAVTLFISAALEIAAVVCPLLVRDAPRARKPKALPAPKPAPSKAALKAQAAALSKEGWRQVQIANHLGCSQAQVSRLLNNQERLH